ncbi:unnamed protein product [Discosporangium mesarthrocarpum]
MGLLIKSWPWSFPWLQIAGPLCHLVLLLSVGLSVYVHDMLRLLMGSFLCMRWVGHGRVFVLWWYVRPPTQGTVSRHGVKKCTEVRGSPSPNPNTTPSKEKGWWPEGEVDTTNLGKALGVVLSFMFCFSSSLRALIVLRKDVKGKGCDGVLSLSPLLHPPLTPLVHVRSGSSCGP